MLEIFCIRYYREGKKKVWIGKAFTQAVQSGKWDFSNSVICNATLPPKTTLKMVNFVGTTFVNVDFQNATFERIHLHKTIFIDVRGLVIKEGTRGDWMIYNSYEPEKRNRKVLNGKGFLNAINRRSNFDDHIICNVTFPEGSEINNISLRGAILINVNCKKAELIDVGIRETIYIEVKGLSLERIKLTTVDIKDGPTGEIYHMQKILGPPIVLR